MLKARKMARTSSNPLIVQSAPLREQVCEAIRLGLRRGEIEPGQRLMEVDLAQKYGVSRTPVREALFQLARDGLIVSSERGFVLPSDSFEDFADRLEAHMLIDPRVAYHAAKDGTADELKTLEKAFEKGLQAHQSNRLSTFIEANYVYRITWRTMCRNVPLARCATMLEDQFLAARNEFYKDPANREIALHYDQKLLTAMQARDSQGSEAVTRQYMEALIEKFVKNRPTDSQA